MNQCVRAVVSVGAGLLTHPLPKPHPQEEEELQTPHLCPLGSVFSCEAPASLGSSLPLNIAR